MSYALDCLVFEVRLNGAPVPATVVHRNYDKVWVIDIKAPELEQAARLLPEIDKAVSLDRAVRMWYEVRPTS